MVKLCVCVRVWIVCGSCVDIQIPIPIATRIYIYIYTYTNKHTKCICICICIGPVYRCGYLCHVGSVCACGYIVTYSCTMLYIVKIDKVHT